MPNDLINQSIIFNSYLQGKKLQTEHVYIRLLQKNNYDDTYYLRQLKLYHTVEFSKEYVCIESKYITVLRAQQNSLAL